MSSTFGFSSLGCPELSLVAVLDLAEERGIGAVELRALRGTTDLPKLFKSEYVSPGILGSAVLGRKAAVVALGTSVRLMDWQEADRHALLDYAPWAEALGARRLRVFDGGSVSDPDGLKRAAGAIDWWRSVRAREGWGVDLMVETHDSLVTAAAVRRFTDAVPGGAILWDSHHTWMKGSEDPVSTWREIRDRVCHVHVKDSVPEASDGLPYRYVVPGTGQFPFADLSRELRASGFSGTVCLEWEKLWHPDLPSLPEALDSARRHGWF
jgi:sugar phosphate isomerase/epimerase